MYTIYTTEDTAIKLSIAENEICQMYYISDNTEGKVVWVKDGDAIPSGATPYSNKVTTSVIHFSIYHTSAVTANDNKTSILKAVMKYNDDEDDDVTVWSAGTLDTLTPTVNISGVEFSKVAELGFPCSSCIRPLFGETNIGFAKLYLEEFIVSSKGDFEELKDLDESETAASNTLNIKDPSDAIAGIQATPESRHITVTINTPDIDAFIKRFDKGYACYKLAFWKFDGNVDTDNTLTGVASRTKFKEEEYLVSLDKALEEAATTKKIQFYIYPRVTDPSVAYIVVEACAVFWKNDSTSLADMHTGVIDPDVLYISKNPLSLSDKSPLLNGFYDVNWDDCMLVYSGDAQTYLESQGNDGNYTHTPGPSTLKVYNCIKTSDPISSNQGGSNKSYTLFKIQADKEQIVSTPTSIIVPYYDVICTVGTAALESISNNQSDSSNSDLWTSQK